MAKASKKTPWALVEVIADEWGTYKKGDKPPVMLRSTADACVAHGIVKIIKDVKDTPLAKPRAPKIEE